MRLLVCGGRDYTDQNLMNWILQAFHMAKGPIIELVNGGCPTGADKFATDWANDHDVQVRIFHADWRIFNAGAGPIRNAEMTGWFAEQEGLKMAIAFPGGSGTADTVRLCKKLNIPCVTFNRNEKETIDGNS